MGNETAEFVEWCVANWHVVRVSKFRNSDKVKFPEYPDFQFLYSFRRNFLDVWNDPDFYTRINQHPKAGLAVHYRKQGMTTQQAIEAIGKDKSQDKRKADLDDREARLKFREDMGLF